LYALEIYYTLNDVPTKIEKTTANIQEGKIYYNLQGQRVNNPSKGIYIVDGKKILIK
jgi:chaperone required for assembly of F1-ATPase